MPTPDFDRLAESYDRLRPQDGAWWQRFEALVEVLAVRGGRVLDIGCGTGTLAAALAERALARVWGVDPSAEMLAVARARVPRAVGLRQGRAEELPFRDGWFDAVVLSLVVHLLDRRRAFAEAARVLAPGGRIGIATFAPEHFDSYWLNPWFPGIAQVDRRRFPTPPELERELGEAGFADLRFARLVWTGALTREAALERIRGRHISSFDLLDEEAIRVGSERAERELPELVETTLVQLVAGASLPR